MHSLESCALPEIHSQQCEGRDRQRVTMFILYLNICYFTTPVCAYVLCTQCMCTQCMCTHLFSSNMLYIKTWFVPFSTSSVTMYWSKYQPQGMFTDMGLILPNARNVYGCSMIQFLLSCTSHIHPCSNNCNLDCMWPYAGLLEGTKVLRRIIL